MTGSLKERLEGRLNPIMVKEMYQAVHSRLFMACYWLLLTLALFIYLIAYLIGLKEHDPAGRYMFYFNTFLMGIMMVFLVPLTAFLNLHGEVSSRTLELVQITGLSPKRLIRGSLAAAAVKIVLSFSVIAPFTLASYLYGGMDFLYILLVVCLLLMASLIVTAASLAAASLAVFPRVRAFIKWFFVAALFLGVPFVVVPMFQLLYFFMTFRILPGHGPSTPDVETLAAVVGASLVLSVLLILFFNAVSANALTFPHNRSSVRTKIVTLAIVIGVFGVLLTPSLFFGGRNNEEMVLGAQIPCCVFLFIASLIWLTADPHVPRRHKTMLAKKGRFIRDLYRFFRDGPVSAGLYLFLVSWVMIGCTGLYLLVDWSQGRSWSRREFAYACAAVPVTVTYTLYLLALAGLATALLPLKKKTATTRRVVLLLVIVITCVLSFMVLIMSGGFIPDPSISAAFLPMHYLVSLDNCPELSELLGHLFGPFLIGLLWYLHIAMEAKRKREDIS